MALTPEMFEQELAEAIATYDRFVVCLDKPPEDCKGTLANLMAKAISAYETRGTGLRHGIALDRHVTIILSQSATDADRPLCAIYFNLSSPYHRQHPARQEAKVGG
ncbi:MAG: hypothetical protein FJ386_06875 [Verrucomicrobia bacterium]|nr:hypothetical protein [Verrucomicrobiota bacterium]